MTGDDDGDCCCYTCVGSRRTAFGNVNGNVESRHEVHWSGRVQQLFQVLHAQLRDKADGRGGGGAGSEVVALAGGKESWSRQQVVQQLTTFFQQPDQSQRPRIVAL